MLRIRTNPVLIVTTALGYFYFTGIETLDLSSSARTTDDAFGRALLLSLLGVGALGGLVVGDRLADWLVARGHVNGRIVVGGASFVLAALLFLPALIVRSLALSMPFYIVAAAAFGARDPALDAARLDVTHHRLWGRAEAVRTPAATHRDRHRHRCCSAFLQITSTPLVQPARDSEALGRAPVQEGLSRRSWFSWWLSRSVAR